MTDRYHSDGLGKPDVATMIFRTLQNLSSLFSRYTKAMSLIIVLCEEIGDRDLLHSIIDIHNFGYML